MKTIYKYTLDLWPEIEPEDPYVHIFTVEMPEGAEVLHMGWQPPSQPDLDEPFSLYRIQVWALIDTDSPACTRSFSVYGTGYEIPDFDGRGNYVGTVLMGPLVWHVFDRGER